MITIAGSNGGGTDISTALGESFKSIARPVKNTPKKSLVLSWQRLLLGSEILSVVESRVVFSFGSPKVNPILSLGKFGMSHGSKQNTAYCIPNSSMFSSRNLNNGSLHAKTQTKKGSELLAA